MAFYEQVDEGEFRATGLTRGPWDPDHQHAGPPAALLGGEVEAALEAGAPVPGRVVRTTFEILRPAEITTFRVTTELPRPGKRVALAQGVMSDERGPVLLCRAWRIRAGDVELDRDPDDRPAPSAAGEGEDHGFFDVPWDEGYHTAMEYRFVGPGFMEFGDTFAWFRTRVPVVAGREVTPLQRVLVAADSGNGISARFHPRDWLFVNPDLSVALREHPADEWVGLEASTRFGPDGIGIATTRIHGAQGELGHGVQTLIVEPQRRG